MTNLIRVLLFTIPLTLTSVIALAQNQLKVIVKDSINNAPLQGASVVVKTINKETLTDLNGEVSISGIPNGFQTIGFRFVGYISRLYSIQFPMDKNGPLIVYLQPNEDEELDEVIISSTRSSRTISAIPTRVEVIAGEELDEKGNMKPGDIRMILNESTGIQTQQTSATSANASIRIQGLDGRYTQLLKDGFPLFSGAASGLGLLQTPPLDLKQVEVIKGSASTLYGGGAIAGLVNLISKTPNEVRELHIHLNGTTAGGLDLNGFYAEQYGKAGVTLFTSRNSNSAYAPGNSEFSAIPEFTRYVLNPKLFLAVNNNTTLNFGINSSFEDRTGGYLQYFKGVGDASQSFFERNKSDRLSSQFEFKHILAKNSSISIRNSLSYFNRKITIPTYGFNGTQYGSFTEANFKAVNKNSEWVAGLNLWTDKFIENQKTTVPLRNYTQTTFGAFVQNNIHAADWLELETGLRTDFVSGYGLVILPRISGLVKINDKVTSRIGGGLGYKAPTIFTEESERVQYRYVLPITVSDSDLEKSFGANWDINYRTLLLKDQLGFSINHLFFYTNLNKPLNMVLQSSGNYKFNNRAGHIDTRGMETNVKFTWLDFKLFIGYSLTDAKIHEGELHLRNPLTAKHRLNNVLMYELEDKWKIGAEAYYYSDQELNDGSLGKPYWIFGFMAEKLWERFSIYINFENFTDTRQTRFDSIYSGGVSNPVFRDIYAPLDGFVVNGGLKLNL